MRTLLFLAATLAIAQSLTEIRLDPTDIKAIASQLSQLGKGIEARVLLGNPDQPGLYTVLLVIPPHTILQAHSHRDTRIATVVSGVWHFGYGDHYDPQLLKTLPTGSVYSEPGGLAHNHFGSSSASAAVIQITGYGPTDTHYFKP